MKVAKRELIKRAWDLYRGHWKLLTVVTLVMFFLGVMIDPIYNWLTKINDILAVIVALVLWLVQIITALGSIRVTLNLVDNNYAEFRDLFWEYKLILSYLVAAIIVGFLTILGLVFLIIPGIYIGTRLQFYLYFMVDQKLGPLAAIRESWAATQGNVIQIFLLNILLGLIMFLGALALGVGVLVAAPVTLLATTYFYRELEKVRK